MSTTDPAGSVASLTEIVNGAFGAPPKYEGYYLELRDSNGGLVLIQAASFRTGVGRRWTRPDLGPRRG